MELIEGEIRRREALIQAGTFFAEDHREVAQAPRIVLEAYTAPPAVENIVIAQEPLREKWWRKTCG